MPDSAHLFRGWPSLHVPASRRQLSFLVAATILSLLLLVTWHNQEDVRRVVAATLHSTPASIGQSQGPLCRHLPGAEDVVVVMKTGANEVEDKLAVHLRTTLTCYPNLAIFSDYEEDLPTGEHIYDSFTYTSPSLKETSRDFALWRKLQTEGRAGLAPDELSGTDSREKSEDLRKTIPGWALHKWKFLPMVNQTLGLYPDKHWYVFLEADTYLFWSNVLKYLSRRSWADDHYIGSQVSMPGLGFAHGGSGFVLSRPALEKVVRLYQSDPTRWEHHDGYWVGDHMLAIALKDAGVLLTNGYPTWQGDAVGLLQFSPNGGLWCSDAMTFHHELPTEIEDLFRFEQTLISEGAGSTSSDHSRLFRHRDIFEQYVLPRIHQSRAAWNNHADLSRLGGAESRHECEAICEQDSSCLQYAFHADGSCKTTSKVIYGEPADGIESGWMIQRIKESIDTSKGC